MTFNEELKDYLLGTFNDARLVSGGSEVVMRCRFCGDSQSDMDARHLYVKVDGDVPVYNCFKCNARGVLTEDTLKSFKPDYQDRDIAMMENLRQHNHSASKSLKSVKLKNNVFNIRNQFITMNHLSDIKLKYINKRLGLNLSFKDLIDNKIVLNLWDLLNSNYIKEYTRYNKDIDFLNNFGIGFLSLDNGFVSIKNLADKGTAGKYLDNKYNTYTIFKNADGIRSYMIPTQVRLDILEPIKIHIAEGPFDALSIFYHLNNANRFQNIYLATCDKGYAKAIKMFVTRYGFMNAEYHLYVDNDVSSNNPEIKFAIQLIHTIGAIGYIHRNGYPGEKDMGVYISHIKDNVIRI